MRPGGWHSHRAHRGAKGAIGAGDDWGGSGTSVGAAVHFGRTHVRGTCSPSEPRSHEAWSRRGGTRRHDRGHAAAEPDGTTVLTPWRHPTARPWSHRGGTRRGLGASKLAPPRVGELLPGPIMRASEESFFGSVRIRAKRMGLV
jgi:hypothetical protein